MSIIQVYKDYNNYFNRIIKKSNKAIDYLSNAYETFGIDTPMNFNENDGVFTQHIINWEHDYIPDYLTVLNSKVELEPTFLDEYFSEIRSYDGISTTRWYHTLAELESLKIYDPTTETFKLYEAAVLDNPNYSTAYIELNNFGFAGEKLSFKLSQPHTSSFDIEIYGENNIFVFNSSSIGTDGIVNFDFFKSLGYDLTGDTIYSITFRFSSPDEANGTLTFADYNSEMDIKSSWFILEAKRTRGNQYLLQLKRDLIADNYDNVINAPMLIDRAMITNRQNPLLYNPEGFSFNQIKKNEILLKDESQIAWYVLYFKKGIASLSDSFNLSDVNYDLKLSTTLANSIFNPSTQYYATNFRFHLFCRPSTNDWGWSYESYVVMYDFDNIGTYATELYKSNEIAYVWFTQNSYEVKNQLGSAIIPILSTIENEFNTEEGHSSTLTEDEYNLLISMNNKYVLDSDNKLYKINVSSYTTGIKKTKSSGTAVSTVKSAINSTTLNRSDHWGSSTFQFTEDLKTIIVSATEITSSTITWSIDFGTQQTTIDSDFNIVAIPYESIIFDNGSEITIDSNNSQLLVQSITQKAATNLVDLQLIPYCPIQKAISGTNKIASANMPTEQYFIDSNNKIIMLFPQSSNITFNIEESISIPTFTTDAAINAKISNECDLFKIVSPNYNGSFEFSVAKNNGVDYFNIDMTLIPYSPYIHVNPNFKFLYGNDWNDSKGLLCGGDFSLPKYTDAWEQYQLNNKNYQQIFDRQIRNLDFTQNQEKILQQVGMATGIIQGGISGSMTGAMVGGGWGALAGGIIGTATSTVGGAADLAMLTARQGEQKSYAIDSFNYQLGNIKALPDTINKTTPLTFNNKKFPFIEYYSATDTEKTLLEKSITYKSMKVNSIGTINEYLQDHITFISGILIRFEDLGLNSNEAYEIYNEIMKGVYI